MNKYLSDVKIFHNTYGLLIPDKPSFPDIRIVDLRMSLIKEEFAELQRAIADHDVVEIADALVDLLYVTNGGILDFGLQGNMSDSYYDINLRGKVDDPEKPTGVIDKKHKDFDLLSAYIQLLDLVVKNNADIKYVFEAYWLTVEAILSLAQRYGLKNYFEACHNEVQASNMSKLDRNGKAIYREDGKVMKGPDFFKPNLKKVLNINPV